MPSNYSRVHLSKNGRPGGAAACGQRSAMTESARDWIVFSTKTVRDGHSMLCDKCAATKQSKFILSQAEAKAG